MSEQDREAPEAARLRKRQRYLARRLAPLELREALNVARLIVNDFHTCATADELNRWRLAQQSLIDAAIAVGRAIEQETERTKDKLFEATIRATGRDGQG